jgi:uncharacterized Zn-binding protein involved in type VI secretion
MPIFPAAKMTDMIIGIDMHTLFIPPAPAPIPFIPHPYFGPIYLWSTPTFPKMDVFINGMPAASTGAMGYYAHIPQGIPNPPTMTNCPSYWKRYITNIPKALVLMMLTIFANIAIGLISALVPLGSVGKSFVKDVTGIDTTSHESIWASWVKLLIPPIPYPGDQGSVAIGSPNVTVNGGSLAFVAPMMATSCTEMPFSLVPNAATIGFSNVMVGVTLAAMIKGIAAHAAKGAVSAGVQKAASKIPGMQGTG